ncbi:MAG: hypothetical protein K8H86_00225, partial [Ignavibacteriaceae bacterium]|nr:hypothetical protein [Ignavibacteriaceae bacterium]
LVSIQDIQFNADSLGSDPASVLNGDTVRVRGVIIVSPIVHPDTNRLSIISAGARWVTYIEDPNGNAWGGLNILQEDTTGANQQTFFDLVDTAQVVEFTGVVTEYFTTTELLMLLNPITPVQIVSQLPKRPDPIELELSDLFTESNTYNFEMEKYENMYVVFRNIITSDRETNGEFKLNDGNGHSAFMYNQSRYFKQGSGSYGNWTAPQDGSYISYVRGILSTRTDGYYIIPIYPGDVGSVIQSPPVISTIKRNSALVAPNQAITISAKITDLDGFVSEAKVLYSVNDGALDSVSMSKNTPDTTSWSAVIPGVSSDSALVSFYIKSKDNVGNTSHGPSNYTTGKYFYLVLNRLPKVADVQYSPYGSGYSAYNGYRIQLTGVVTADTSDLPGYSSTPLRVYMQDGQGAWSGIQIGTLGSMGTNVLSLVKGDNITAEGVILESFDVTKIDSLSILTINSGNNPLPEPISITTGEMGLAGNNQLSKEKWESVLVKFVTVTVDSGNADGSVNHGEILVNDGTGKTRVELQDGNHIYHNAWDTTFISNPNFTYVKKGDTFSELRGIMYYSFGNYKLVPRKNDDFVGYTPVGVQEIVQRPTEYSLQQNYPNPFNPSTSITYSVAKDGLVRLKIFNILG